ncbi:MAG TPA: hypothetical protein DDW78_01205 [Treponema sp.]|nr:hypothetical protein [Treponema sp.]
MNFWETVDSEREYRNLSRKELAYRADFSLTSLSTGIKRGSVPAADVALRIAKVLGVSVEYLLTGLEPEASPRRTMPDSLQKYQKHRLLIDEFDSLPPNVQESIGNMIREVKQACTEPA